MRIMMIIRPILPNKDRHTHTYTTSMHTYTDNFKATEFN